mmetsp:Transcript_37643/g.74452  ORF Transcript_37643/g.74452 Transcript_37643/m.74452 type:complete len:172 (+) Transcript_37643:67-582(+)
MYHLVYRLLLLALSSWYCRASLDTQLREATGAGDTPKVLRLLSMGADANAKGGNEKDPGETPLHLACIGGDSALVAALISAGANTNSRATGPSSLRMTPLTWCAYGGHDEAVEVLLSKGNADPNLIVDDEQGNKLTALDIAFRVGDNLGGRPLRTRVLLESSGGKIAADLV